MWVVIQTMQTKRLILKKISKELNIGIKTEAQALYFLAEIRKILESDDKERRILRIFCVWALHNKLSFDKTIAYFSDKFKHHIENNIDIKKAAKDLISNQSNFFKLSELKKELGEFLKDYNLPRDLVSNSGYWFIFNELLLEILKESLIIFGEGEINNLSIDRDKNGNNYYKYQLRNGKPSIKIKLKIK